MKTHHKILGLWCACMAVFAGISEIFSFLVAMDYFVSPVSRNDDRCVRTMAVGFSEDQTRFDSNSFLLTDWKTHLYLPGEDRPGAIYVGSGFQQQQQQQQQSSSPTTTTKKSTKDFVEQDLIFGKLPIVGYPAGVDFHPHGMYIYHPDKTLYVINHGYENGGERIDVFGISTTIGNGGGNANANASDREIPNRLIYKYSITSDWMKRELNGILNGLVVIEPNKFYVTQFEAKPHDRTNDGWFGFEARQTIVSMRTLVFKPRETFVWYCEYNDDDDDDDDDSNRLSCRKVADGFVLANGITHNRDRSKIFVSDTLAKTVAIFDRDAKTNDLRPSAIVNVPSATDNLKFDEGSGKVYGGVIVNMFTSNSNGAEYPKEFEDSISGVLELSHDGGGGWTARNVLATSKLNGVTNALRMNDYYVMGSGWIGYRGLLVCPVSVVDDDGAERKSRSPGTSEL